MVIRRPIEARTDARTAFGAALRYWRERQGYSQADLATRTGFDRTMVCRLEQGTRVPSRECAVAMADALHLHGADRLMLLSDAGYIEAALTEEQAQYLAAD